MKGAWWWTIRSRLGLFSAMHGNSQSREQPLSFPHRPPAPQFEAHVVWLDFLQDRFQSTNKRNVDVITL